MSRTPLHGNARFTSNSVEQIGTPAFLKEVVSHPVDFVRINFVEEVLAEHGDLPTAHVLDPHAPVELFIAGRNCGIHSSIVLIVDHVPIQAGDRRVLTEEETVADRA